MDVLTNRAHFQSHKNIALGQRTATASQRNTLKEINNLEKSLARLRAATTDAAYIMRLNEVRADYRAFLAAHR